MKRRGEEGEEEERIPRRRLRSSGRLQCIWRKDLLPQALLEYTGQRDPYSKLLVHETRRPCKIDKK